MLAQKLADIGCPAEITYLDISRASRAVAEARARDRRLGDITFLTGDLLDAPARGPFDYIDCCGVLHHLPDPEAGFAALAESLAPGGGIGLMVYAPYGRTGVYALQAAFGRLFEGDAPEDQVRMARSVLDALPGTHWFARNPFLGDHRDSDAGLYDLLLHSRDRPYTVAALVDALEHAGLAPVSFLEPARYDPLRYLPKGPEITERVCALPPLERMDLAERLAGNIKTHVVYSARPGQGLEATPGRASAVPHLSGAAVGALARQVAARGRLRLALDGLDFEIELPKTSAPLIAAIGGRSLKQIADAAGLDWLAFGIAWAPVHRALTGFNLLHYSEGATR